MNTRLVVCLALLFAVASAFDLRGHASLLNVQRAEPRAVGDCPVYKCAKVGESCSVSDTTYTICLGNSSCSGLTSGTCTANPALKTLDAACTLSSECYSNLCVNSKCNQGYEPGTPCTSANQCAYIINGTFVTACTSGRCAGIALGGYCNGDSQCSPPQSCGPENTCISARAAGGNCDEDENCDKSAFCNDDGKCAALLAIGASCTTDVNSCAGTGLCTPSNADGTTRTCVEAFSLSVGAFCDDSYQCGSGQNCSYSSNGIGRCQNIKSSFKDCDVSSATPGCDAGETCECGGDAKGICIQEGIANPSGLKDSYSKAYSCINQCQRADTPCLAEKCHNQVCKVTQSIFNSFFDSVERLTPSCAEDEINVDLTIFEGYGYKCSSASMAQVSAVLALVALVAMVL